MSFTPELNRPVGSPEPTVNYKDPQHAEFLKFLDSCRLPAAFQGYHDHLFHIYYTGWLKGVERDTPVLEKGKPDNATGMGGCDLAYYKSLATNLQRQQSVWHQERTQLNGDKLILLRALKGVQDVLRTALEAVEARQMMCDSANSMKKPVAGADRQEASEQTPPNHPECSYCRTLG